ncbi:hypothetical protein F4678DRAFT_456181 [Xylaria arbuscula]|nr:hypothetical protein F4678DRAFT_456181 [Xylaria arbuscula]
MSSYSNGSSSHFPGQGQRRPVAHGVFPNGRPMPPPPQCLPAQHVDPNMNIYGHPQATGPQVAQPPVQLYPGPNSVHTQPALTSTYELQPLYGHGSSSYNPVLNPANHVPRVPLPSPPSFVPSQPLNLHPIPYGNSMSSGDQLDPMIAGPQQGFSFPPSSAAPSVYAPRPVVPSLSSFHRPFAHLGTTGEATDFFPNGQLPNYNVSAPVSAAPSSVAPSLSNYSYTANPYASSTSVGDQGGYMTAQQQQALTSASISPASSSVTPTLSSHSHRLPSSNSTSSGDQNGYVATQQQQALTSTSLPPASSSFAPSLPDLPGRNLFSNSTNVGDKRSYMAVEQQQVPMSTSSSAAHSAAPPGRIIAQPHSTRPRSTEPRSKFTPEKFSEMIRARIEKISRKRRISFHDFDLAKYTKDMLPPPQPLPKRRRTGLAGHQPVSGASGPPGAQPPLELPGPPPEEDHTSYDFGGSHGSPRMQLLNSPVQLHMGEEGAEAAGQDMQRVTTPELSLSISLPVTGAHEGSDSNLIMTNPWDAGQGNHAPVLGGDPYIGDYVAAVGQPQHPQATGEGSVFQNPFSEDYTNSFMTNPGGAEQYNHASVPTDQSAVHYNNSMVENPPLEQSQYPLVDVLEDGYNVVNPSVIERVINDLRNLLSGINQLTEHGRRNTPGEIAFFHQLHMADDLFYGGIWNGNFMVSGSYVFEYHNAPPLRPNMPDRDRTDRRLLLSWVQDSVGNSGWCHVFNQNQITPARGMVAPVLDLEEYFFRRVRCDHTLEAYANIVAPQYIDYSTEAQHHNVPVVGPYVAAQRATAALWNATETDGSMVEAMSSPAAGSNSLAPSPMIVPTTTLAPPDNPYVGSSVPTAYVVATPPVNTNTGPNNADPSPPCQSTLSIDDFICNAVTEAAEAHPLVVEPSTLITSGSSYQSDAEANLSLAIAGSVTTPSDPSVPVSSKKTERDIAGRFSDLPNLFEAPSPSRSPSGNYPLVQSPNGSSAQSFRENYWDFVDLDVEEASGLLNPSWQVSDNSYAGCSPLEANQEFENGCSMGSSAAGGPSLDSNTFHSDLFTSSDTCDLPISNEQITRSDDGTDDGDEQDSVERGQVPKGN